MAGSTFGTLFKITTWGESHGKGIGVVVDGCPAGLALSEEDIQAYLDRRKPGQSRYATQRKEADAVEILSGVFEGKTTGTPISMAVQNQDQRSRDYSEIASIYRPGHADFTFDAKYGFRDYRGGGRSSGRETIGRVAAGAVADKDEIQKNALFMPDGDAAKKAKEYLESCMEHRDSSGGVIECVIDGVPIGLGDPVFEKLDANLAKAIFSIGAVKGFSLGDGFFASRAKGSENNDGFFIAKDGQAKKSSNHSGGTLGGISDGSPIVFQAAIKPTPSIAAPQQTVTVSGEEAEISIHGRHDPVIVPRAVVVVESMAALTVCDAMLLNMTAKVDSIRAFYKK